MSDANAPGFFRGGCACGAVTYECSAAPLRMLICYCRDCQRANGGFGAPTIVVPTGAIVVHGIASTYEVTAESGNVARRSFCGRCGTPLFSVSSARPEFTGIRAGSLQDASWFVPAAEVWVSSQQPWHCRQVTGPKYNKGRPVSPSPT